MSRIDKYLWHARFFKSRSLAAQAVSDGRVRLNGAHCTKPAAGVKAGDVLTLTLGHAVRIVRVVAFGVRRGPASEARLLYEDLTPPPPPRDAAPEVTATPHPARRPTRREREALTRLKGKHFED